MKYSIDTKRKEITINSACTAQELLDVIDKQFPDTHRELIKIALPELPLGLIPGDFENPFQDLDMSDDYYDPGHINSTFTA
jgi:hypothetical protein